jgi:hypothetical protein
MFYLHVYRVKKIKLVLVFRMKFILVASLLQVSYTAQINAYNIYRGEHGAHVTAKLLVVCNVTR